MNDLDTLRPEVAEAVAAIDGGNGVFVYSDDGIGNEKWQIVRAELLRLAKIEEERWAVVATRNGALERAEKAEAELAAIKARIAEAPVGVFGLCYNGHEPGFLGFPQAIDNLPRESMLGKLVRLLVEE